MEAQSKERMAVIVVLRQLGPKDVPGEKQGKASNDKLPSYRRL